jgi:pimeloyl-ACP methyl ester carboxylesterase
MIERPDRTEALREAEVPVLIVGGRCDNAVPLKDVLEQSYIPEVSYIHILENSGHMGMAEEPEMMNAAIKEFTDHCYKHRI